MTEYKLDDLGWDRFEQLVQSLLKEKLGLGIEAWGGSGDWGRDACFDGELKYPTNEPLRGIFVFQCKFVEGANAAGAKPQRAISSAVRKECSRIQSNLSTAGRWSESPKCYAFFTNARLTPSSRRSVQRALERVLPASKVCIHDGSDICQWIRVTPDIWRSFEPLNGTQKNEVRARLTLAQTLIRQGKHSEGIREAEAALALARAAKFAKEEVEVLLALALFPSSHRGISNRRGHLAQAEKIIESIDDALVRVLYFRARAAACRDERDPQGAEEAFRLALRCCENPKEDKKNIETQACVIRSDLVMLLCQQGRHTEADELITASDAYARSNASDEDGELMQAAMAAGIFWALKTGNEEEALRRIRELETTARTAYQAVRIAGQLSNTANDSSYMGFHRVAMSAAEAAVRLGQKSDDEGDFLVGALYTVAVVAFKSGDHATAKRKAEALRDACNSCRDPQGPAV